MDLERSCDQVGDRKFVAFQCIVKVIVFQDRVQESLQCTVLQLHIIELLIQSLLRCSIFDIHCKVAGLCQVLDDITDSELTVNGHTEKFC